jgi:hypothetical protein
VQGFSQNYRVVEPFLEVALSQPLTQPDGNDRLTFTLTVAHAPASSAAAYQGLVSVPIEPQYLLQPASINVLAGTLEDSTPLLHVVNSSFFTVYFDAFGNRGHTLQAVYEVIVIDAIRPRFTVLSSAAVEWTSTPVTYILPGRERRVDDPLYPAATTVQSTTSAEPSQITYLNRTSLVDTLGRDVNIGEEAVFQTCITLIEGVRDSVLELDLELGLAFINISVLRIGSNLRQVNGSVGQKIAPQEPRFARLALGEVVNLPDNLQFDADVLCVETAVLVENMYVLGRGGGGGGGEERWQLCCRWQSNGLRWQAEQSRGHVLSECGV